MSTEEKLSRPVRMFNAANRAVIITHSYTGNGNGDPNGYYYHFEDAPNSRHWISAGAVGIRFSETPKVELALKTLVAQNKLENRREATIRAAMAGINAIAAEIGAVSIITTPKGFCVVYDNDDRMYFDGLEI
jgi:hypothetical protein